MKKIILLTILTLPLLSQAQFGNLLDKAKNKVKQRVDNKVDKAMDESLDKAEGKGTPANTDAKTASVTSVSASSAKTPSVVSYSKFDFVPGERVIYAEDFSQDVVGELPLTWNASGKGEVMTIEGKTGKWLRAFENTTYLAGCKKSFGENYTIEFDVMYFFEPKKSGYVLPNWRMGFFSSGTEDATGNTFLKGQDIINSTMVNFSFGSYSGAAMESRLKRQQSFHSDRMELGDMTGSFNKVIHYSIQVQKTRFRLWINEKKVFDIPRAINVGDTMNQLFFFLEGSNYQEDEIGLFISNIKVATGLPDTRHKLIDEGKFSTTGILFDVNAATIKAESYGVLKEIAGVLNEHKDVRVKITGHTDSDGADAANLELSKKRAEAVKAALVKDFNVDGASLETDGKGETKPVSDNKTKEGKAQNRRVEFVKL
jgi:outer membrane protein OmpA-like peptidoglycan-associated protein